MDTNLASAHCDFKQLECYLDASLDEAAANVVEDHLTDCSVCRERMDVSASSRVDWQRTQELLRRDELDKQSAELDFSHFDANEVSPGDEAAMLSREIRGWLDPTDDPQMLGRFAGYEIVGVIGHGGMGIVLKGVEQSLNRFVAIKVLAPRLATNGTARKRFAREARAAAAVLHDNVIAIHRVDEWHGLPFLVMPYVGGASLQKRIDNEGPLSVESALRVGVQIASGLAAAHEKGLIHRDIKPANILLDQGVERVTITDFGLARAADDASMTRTGVIAGTPQYMSPEQAEAKAMDGRSDLFSLGSVLYTMVCGRPPFRGDGSFEVLKRVANEPVSPLHAIDPAIPVWFDNLVARLHQKSVDDRPRSAVDVQRLLNDCLLHLTQPDHALPKELAVRPKPLVRRNWILAIPILVLTAVFAWLMFGQSPIDSKDVSRTSASQFLRRTATTSQVRVMGESARNHTLELRIQKSKYNKELAWTTSTQEGSFTAIVSRTPVPTGPGTSAPGFTFELVNDESGGGATVNIACTPEDPLPDATIHFEMVKPEARDLLGKDRVDKLRIGTLKYPDGTEAAVTLLIRALSKQIGTVLGKPIYESDMKAHLSDSDNFIRLFMTPMTDHYCKQQAIDRSKELDERIKDPGMRHGAELFVNRWELQRHLYNKYGGRVQLDAFGPCAVDGYRKWKEERKRVGDYTITDPKVKARFEAWMFPDESKMRFASPDAIKDAFDPANTEGFIEHLAGVPEAAEEASSTLPSSTADIVINAERVPASTTLWNVAGAVFEPVTEDEQITSEWIGGLRVTHLRENGPAEDAMIRIGDIVVEIDGEPIATIEALDRFWGRTSFGPPLSVRLRRDSDEVVARMKWDPRFLQPLATGVVQDRDKSTVVVSLGTDDGVYPGDQLHRANLPPCTLEVVTATAEQCSTRVICEDERRPIKEGEIVNYGQMKFLTPPTPSIRSAEFATDIDNTPKTITISQAITVRSSREFPLERVEDLVASIKKKTGVAGATAELRRITGLDFGEGVEQDSRRDWLDWWQGEVDCIDAAAGKSRPFIVVGSVNDDEGLPVAGASIWLQVPFKNSGTGKYRLAHTVTDHKGRYVLSFGLPLFAKSEMESLLATFSVKPTAGYRIPKRSQPIALQIPVAQSLLNEATTMQKNWLRPNAPRSINFKLEPKKIEDKRELTD